MHVARSRGNVPCRIVSTILPESLIITFFLKSDCPHDHLLMILMLLSKFGMILRKTGEIIGWRLYTASINAWRVCCCLLSICQTESVANPNTRCSIREHKLSISWNHEDWGCTAYPANTRPCNVDLGAEHSAAFICFFAVLQLNNPLFPHLGLLSTFRVIFWGNFLIAAKDVESPRGLPWA